MKSVGTPPHLLWGLIFCPPAFPFLWPALKASVSPRSLWQLSSSCHCDLLSPRTWAPSCSSTAWNKIELCSFFYHCQANGCCDICKAPVAAWVFCKRHVSGRVGVGAEHAAGRRGRGEGGRGFRGLLTLKRAWGTYLASSVQHPWGSNAPISLSHLKVDWQHTPRSHPQMELAHGWSTHPEGVSGFSSWTWSRQPSQPGTSTSETLGHALGRWWGRRLSRFSLPMSPWGQPGSAAPSALAALKLFHGQITRPDLLCNKGFLNTCQILQHQIKTN